MKHSLPSFFVLSARFLQCADIPTFPRMHTIAESLPKRFFRLVNEDFPQADLLIVMGTSLKVH